MSPLAQILHDNGYTVQGSDIEKFIFTQTALEKEILRFFLLARKILNPA